LKEISPGFSEYEKFKENAEAIRLMILAKQLSSKNIPPPKPALDVTVKEITQSFTDALNKQKAYESIKIFFNFQDNKFCIQSKFILSRPPLIGGILYRSPDGYEKKVSVDALKYLLVKQLIDSINVFIKEISSNPKSSRIS